jgi:hypothetical protein
MITPALNMQERGRVGFDKTFFLIILIGLLSDVNVEY